MEWSKGLSRSGLYYEGFVDEGDLDRVLELHKRSTGTTYGTRTSSRLKGKASNNGGCLTESNKENCEVTTVKKTVSIFTGTKQSYTLILYHAMYSHFISVFP